MSDFIIKDPTVVNARMLYENNYDIVFEAIAFEQYNDDFVTIPDGKYYLEHLETFIGPSPLFYLFNSDDKFTGIVLSLEFYKVRDKDTTKIPFKDLDTKYTLVSKKGKYEIIPPKKLYIESGYQERLVSFFSKKINQKVKLNPYPSYIPTQEEMAKSKGTIVSGDTNQPIKGATIEKTD